MATTRTSEDLPASASTVYAMIADPTRLPEWDPTYEEATRLWADPGGEPIFTARRTLANRGMDLACRVVEAEAPGHFGFVCHGGSGEVIHEDFALAPSRDGIGTRVTRELEYDFGNQDPVGVVPELTFTQAWLDRSVEQAFGHLSVLLGGPDSSQ